MKKIIALMCCLAIALSLVACGAKQEAPAATEAPKVEAAPEAAPATEAPAAPAEVITLRFSGSNNPGDTHTAGIEEVKRVLEEISGGTMKLDLYLSGTLFSQDAETEALMNGDLDLCYTSSQWIAEYVDEANMFTAMYLYNDVDHLNAVLNGEIGAELFETVAEKIDVYPLAAYYYGARDCLMVDGSKQYNTPEDMKGVAMRKPNTEAWLFVGEALGANPIPLAFGEMYTALQTHMIDAVANPLPTIINNKLYEVCETVVMTDHILDSVWPTISCKTWDKLNDQQRAWLREAIEAGRLVAEKEMLDREAESIATLEANGLTIQYPDKNAFREFALAKYEESGKTALWDMDLYKTVLEMG